MRSGPLYNLAPTAQLAVVIVGAVTLLFGAIIGCAKDDIKRALAASTISQIGYMVLAAAWVRPATRLRSCICSLTVSSRPAYSLGPAR